MTQTTFQSRRLVVIPMKDPTQAKTRLADSLAPEERAALARTLFRATVERVQTAIAELAGEPVEIEIATVTSSPEIARIASELQIHLINEGRCNSLNAALTHAGAGPRRRAMMRSAFCPAIWLTQPLRIWPGCCATRCRTRVPARRRCCARLAIWAPTRC